MSAIDSPIIFLHPPPTLALCDGALGMRIDTLQSQDEDIFELQRDIWIAEHMAFSMSAGEESGDFDDGDDDLLTLPSACSSEPAPCRAQLRARFAAVDWQP